MPSFILIHLTVWPEYTNVTDRQDRTGQRSDSIGRTVLQPSPKNLYFTRIVHPVAKQVENNKLTNYE